MSATRAIPEAPDGGAPPARAQGLADAGQGGVRGAARYGLPRDSRVLRKGDFARAYKEGARARGALLVVVARTNGTPRPRLGLSVGRAIWKTAVGRNRVKRVFREAFRLEQHALPAGHDLILIPAAARLEPELGAVRRELVKLAHKAARRLAERAGADPP